MDRARINIGITKRLVAETFGEPGHRTFRIIAEAEQGRATIWMEKDQLSALARSVKDHIAQLSDEQRQVSDPAPESSPAEPSFDFKTLSLGLVFDDTTSHFGIIAFDEPDRDKQAGTLIWWAALDQAEAMADAALEIVASGRPICELCRRPQDPEGHMCPHRNGHRAVQEDFA